MNIFQIPVKTIDRSSASGRSRISLALLLTALLVFPDLALSQEPTTCSNNSYWTKSGASLTTPIETFGAAVAGTTSGDVMYVIGGEDWVSGTPTFQTQVLHKLASAVATTNSSTWTFHNDMWKGPAGVPVGFARDLCGVVNNGFLYTIGGVIKDSSISDATGNSTAQVWYAPINSTNGNLGAWKITNSVPVPSGKMGLQLHGSAVVTVAGDATYLYVIGGSNSDHGDGTVNQDITAAVHFAKINSDGSLALWDHDGNGNPASLPDIPSQGVGVYKTCPVVYNGSIYMAGGEAKGQSLNQVVYATPIAGGTFDNSNQWHNVSSNYMSTADAAQAVALSNNDIILMGGDEGSNTITSSVFQGAVAADKSVTWGTLTSLPLAISRNAGATSGSHIFSIAGQNAGNDLTCIYYH
jgi:hypothetical protein